MSLLPEESTVTAPILVHIHIPKTGGTSIASLLQRAGQSHAKLYVNDTHFVYSKESIRSVILGEPEIKYISSHHILTFPPFLGGRRLFYFTILREPIQQFISYLTFIKKVYKDQTSPSLLACLPPDPPSMSLREFARWLLVEHPYEAPFQENYAVNFLARQTYLALHGAHRASDRSHYISARLTLAKAILNQFAFVGLMEQMEESIAELRSVLEYLGLEIPPGPLGMENTSGEFRDDLIWLDPNDEVGGLLYRSLEEDRKLYQWAVERFDNRYWTRRLERNSGDRTAMDVARV